jgi:hypothetical protein
MTIIVNGRPFDDLAQARDYTDWLENHGRPVVVTPRPTTRVNLRDVKRLTVAPRQVPEQFRPSKEKERPMLCKRCSDCRNASHHWLADPQDDGRFNYVCKHCCAVGKVCPTCDGAGCYYCRGEGVVFVGTREQFRPSKGKR